MHSSSVKEGVITRTRWGTEKTAEEKGNKDKEREPKHESKQEKCQKSEIDDDKNHSPDADGGMNSVVRVSSRAAAADGGGDAGGFVDAKQPVDSIMAEITMDLVDEDEDEDAEDEDGAGGGPRAFWLTDGPFRATLGQVRAAFGPGAVWTAPRVDVARLSDREVQLQLRAPSRKAPSAAGKEKWVTMPATASYAPDGARSKRKSPSPPPSRAGKKPGPGSSSGGGGYIRRSAALAADSNIKSFIRQERGGLEDDGDEQEGGEDDDNPVRDVEDCDGFLSVSTAEEQKEEVTRVASARRRSRLREFR